MREYVTKQAQYNDDIPLVHAKLNPILDSWQHVVDFEDSTEDELKSNAIDHIMYAQCDPDGDHYLMLDYIVDFRSSTTAFCYSEQNFAKNGCTYRRKYKSGW